MLAHVQHKALEVPLPVESVLLIGNKRVAVSDSHWTQSKVMFANSISLSIHHDAITATLPGNAGPPGVRGSEMFSSS